MDQRSLWEPMILRNSSATSSGDATSSREHMLAVPPRIPQEGPAISFMNCLAGEGFFEKATIFASATVGALCFQSLSRFPEVRKKESERSLATNLLLRFARNVFVQDSAIEGEKWFHNRAQNEVAICCTINVLELLGTYSDMVMVRRRAAKMGNKLVLGNRRDVVKFVVKRFPCTCLKKLHSATRMKVAKVGQCHNCAKQIPRSHLHVCSGCMLIEYCSEVCQRAHWSYHKQYCGYAEVMSRDLPADYVLRYDR